MLAFIAQISGKSEVMLRASFVAVVIFAVGLALAMLVPYFRHHHSKVANAAKRGKLPRCVLALTPYLNSRNCNACQRRSVVRTYPGGSTPEHSTSPSSRSSLASRIWRYVGYEQAPALNKAVARTASESGV